MVSKFKPIWLTEVFLYAVVSAFLLAGEKAVDSIVSNKFLASVDQITAASSYILVGGWFGVGVVIVLALVFGNLLHVVKPINLNQPKKYAVLAGIAGAIFTFVFLFGLQFIDLQLMYALTSSYLLFVILREWMTGKISLKRYILPGLLVVVGSFIAVYDPAMFTSKQDVDVGTFIFLCALVFVFYNAFFAADELLQKPAMVVADPMNVQLIRFITLAVTATIGVLFVSALRGTLPLLREACEFLINNPDARSWLFVLFVLATVGMLARLIAKDKSENVSKVVIVVAANLAIGLFLSLKLNELWPGAAGSMPTSPEVILLRTVGAVVIAVGVLLLLQKSTD